MTALLLVLKKTLKFISLTETYVKLWTTTAWTVWTLGT